MYQLALIVAELRLSGNQVRLYKCVLHASNFSAGQLEIYGGAARWTNHDPVFSSIKFYDFYFTWQVDLRFTLLLNSSYFASDAENDQLSKLCCLKCYLFLIGGHNLCPIVLMGDIIRHKRPRFNKSPKACTSENVIGSTFDSFKASAKPI